VQGLETSAASEQMLPHCDTQHGSLVIHCWR